MINEDQLLKFKLKASSLVDLWKEFCQSHTDLYELTCDEYLYLLESNIEKLEEAIESKNLILEDISKLDDSRQELIKELSDLSGENLEKFALLSKYLRENDSETEAKHLDGYNALLLDIIEKIQEQNKKNQVFLNKAILSLQDLRQSFTGKKNYKTYGADGVTKSNTSP